MKITVLEHPRIPSVDHFNDIANTPLWSCLMGGYAAAALEGAGFETTFLDLAQPGKHFKEVMARVEELDPYLLCVNGVYFWEHTQALFDFFSDLRAKGFGGHINLFGFFPSLVYREILSTCTDVNSIAVGEFEHTLVALARNLGKSKEPENIEGLATRSCLAQGRDVMRCPEKNPDLFVFPKRSHLSGTVSVLASRGCYNHCSFCPVPSFYNRGSLWRGRSPENIAEEMAMLAARDVDRFYFCDPNFIGPGAKGKQRIMDLMDLIRPMKIRFGMETRPQDLDDAVLEKLTAAGFESLLMGIESGSDRVLTGMDKTSGPRVAARAVELCRRHGIEPEIGFLMFVPDGRLGDLEVNLNFLLENRLLDRLERTANLLSHIQIVLAGTSGYQRFKAAGRLEKQGLFGFQARVRFADPAVEWVAERMVFACRQLLKETGNFGSPLYWEAPEERVSRAANTYLVELTGDLIRRAQIPQKNRSGLEEDRQQIQQEISKILG